MCQLVTLQTNYGANIHVAEIKKRHIENILNSAPLCKQISAIMLFGSSLEERCTKKSDIDIAIISNSSLDKLSQTKAFDKFMNHLYSYDMEQEYDRLYFKSIEEIKEKKNCIPICDELMRKGKVIYRRL